MDDFLGLKVIWPTDGEELENHNYDIVFVHGLHSGSISDWDDRESPLHHEIWPVRLLAKDLVNARILSFGYQGSKSNFIPREDSEEQSIFNHGESLCSDLLDNHQLLKSASPNLVFIGHGAGGIVIKSALCYSHSRQNVCGSVLRKTKHVVFLDTPHDGIDANAWSAISHGTINEKSTGQWALWSTVLGDLQKIFSEIAPRFNITSSCASLKACNHDASDAAPGNTGLTNLPHERTLHFENVNHSTICRFSERDPNYTRLLNRIRAGMVRLTKDDKHIQKIRAWIGIGFGGQSKIQSDSIDWNNKDYKLCLDRYHTGTCEWLFEHELFIDWAHRDTDIRILWLTAPGGTGKSVMCSVVAQRLADGISYPATPYIMLTYKKQRNKCSMATLLASQLIDYALKFRGVDTEVLSLLSQNVTNVENVYALISLLVSQFSTVYFFLDGLNEVSLPEKMMNSPPQLEDDLLSTLQFLSGLAYSKSPTRVRLWCSSQETDQTIDLMKKIGFKYAELVVDKEKVQKDVRQYLSNNGKKSVDKIRDPSERLLGTIGLHSQAGWNFRWAFLMVKTIENATIPQEIITKILQGLPGGLRDLYECYMAEHEMRDENDKKDGNPPLSMNILSTLTFAKRPLRIGEVQEILSVMRLSPRKGSYPNLNQNNLIPTQSLKNRCAPLVDFVPFADDPEDGHLQLSHASVFEFLREPLDSSYKGTQYSTGTPGNIRVDKRYIGEACLRYLSQERYAGPLRKLSSSDFQVVRPKRSPESIREHHFLRYAAKYWYRHLEKVDQQSSDAVKHFMLSPQFITMLQVQSLYVIGHFINNFDQAHDSRKVIKQNIPRWLRDSDEGRYLTQQYEHFLAEWSKFLQLGVTDFMNGEIDSCMWGALGPTHFLHKNGVKIEKNKSFLLEKGIPLTSKPQETQRRCFYDTISDDGTRISVWEVVGNSVAETRRRVSRLAWIVDGIDDPRTYSETEILSFDPEIIGWDLYDFCQSRLHPLQPMQDLPGPVKPIGDAQHGLQIRVGSGLFTRMKERQWLLFNGANTKRIPYWEDILVQNPYTIHSRRKLIEPDNEAIPPMDDRNSRKSKPNPPSDNEVEDSSTEISSEGNHASNHFIPSAEEYWSCESSNPLSSSEGNEREINNSEDEELDSLIEGSTDSHIDTDSNGNQETESNAAWSSSDSAQDSSASFLGQSDSSDEFCTDADDESSLPGDSHSDSASESDEIRGQPRIAQRRLHDVIYCDPCSTRLRYLTQSFYQCPLCNEPNSYDVCSSCFEKGEWCNDKQHQMRKIGLRKGRFITLGTISRHQARSCLDIIVTRTIKKKEEMIFRFRTSTTTILYSSPPILHPTVPLLIYPLDGQRFLFANIEENTYFIHRIRLSDTEMKGGGCWPISIDMRFSECETLVYITRVTGRRTGRSDTTNPIHLFIQHMMVQLNVKNPASRRPTTISRYRGVSLGKWPADAVSQLPYTITWTPTYAYVSISSDWLRVYRISLGTSQSLEADATSPFESLPEERQNQQPEEMIEILDMKLALPRSAKVRQVRFYPPQTEGACAVVVLGSVGGERSQPPAVLYLRPEKIDYWIVAKEAISSFGPELQPRDDPMMEQFDTDSDCDLIVPLKDFQR